MDNNKNKLIGAGIFVIIILIIGVVAVLGNGGSIYFKGDQGIQGLTGNNGLDFNSTIPYTYLFNGTQGLTGNSGLISVSSPLFNNSGVLFLNQTIENGLINIIYSQISDWNSATSSFLTSSTQYIRSISIYGGSVSGSGQLTINDIYDVSANQGMSVSSGVLSLSGVPYSVTNFANQFLLTTSNPTFNSLTLSSYFQLENNIKITWAGSYWQIGYESPPSYASYVTTSAMVIDVYANANQGFMIRAGTSSLLEISSNGAFFSVPIVNKYMSGDYGALWASISLPSGTNGMQLIAYNSNTGVLASRLYIYTNSAWHYIMLT
jgi:hypothetical protein